LAKNSQITFDCMEIKDLDKWEDFVPQIRELRGQYSENSHPIIFRGMADYNWQLKTTLERTTRETFSVYDYLVVVSKCVNQLESVTGKKWDFKSIPEIKKEIKEIQGPLRVHLPHYDYLLYLRHHGYPSPLLDWTESPFIAAYFAFHEKVSQERIAVYAFIGSQHRARGGIVGEPMIFYKGPYVSTHSRHFAQKSWYTIATKYDKIEDHVFCCHEDVLANDNMNQNMLLKITIPTGERKKVLQELNDYNINHFTLFQTEDSLVKTMEINSFYLDHI
jgi:hypothetical protein